MIEIVDALSQTLTGSPVTGSKRCEARREGYSPIDGRWPRALAASRHRIPIGWPFPKASSATNKDPVTNEIVDSSSPPARSRASAATPPNLLFILTDNHGAWTLGCYGNKEIRTPNIDKLAAEGTLFSALIATTRFVLPAAPRFSPASSLATWVHAYIPDAAQVALKLFRDPGVPHLA